MSDSKSKMPDMNEIGSIASKLFKDIKKSVDEIITDYKQKRPVASSDVPVTPDASREVPPKPVVETPPIDLPPVDGDVKKD